MPIFDLFPAQEIEHVRSSVGKAFECLASRGLAFRRVVCGKEAIHRVGLRSQLRLDIGADDKN